MSRPVLVQHIVELTEMGKLPEDFDDHFLEQLREVPWQWKISDLQEGIRFTKDFPYTANFYYMQAWDAAKLVVNLDPNKQAIAFRIHLYDSSADVRIEEGVLVENGEVTAFNQEMMGGRHV